MRWPIAASRAKLGKADAYRVRYIEKAATPFAQFVSGFRWQPRRCLDAVRFGHGADDAGAHDAGSGYAAALRRECGPREGQWRTGEGAGVLLLRVLIGNGIE